MADPSGPEKRDERGKKAASRPVADREIRIDRILGFAGGLALLLGATALGCWLLYAVFRQTLARHDPPPSPVPEARGPVLPPEPRLQRDPHADMAALRAREMAILESWEWADEEAGTARIPIERAMELVATRGLRPALTQEIVPDGGAP